MTRDRDATQQKIIRAVGRVLAREGFRGLGLRAVAREAAVDKRLVSRYFGTLDRLIGTYAATSDFWWTVDELVGDDLPGPSENTWQGWVALALQRHTRALRQRTLTQEILAWELIEANPLTDALSLVREQRAAELLQRIEAKVGVPAQASWRTVGVLLAAATTYLVLRARTYDYYVALDLRKEAAWEEFDRMIAAISNAVIDGAAPAASVTSRKTAARPDAGRVLKRNR